MNYWALFDYGSFGLFFEENTLGPIGVNPLAPRDVSGRTNFSGDFFLSTDFKGIKMPNLTIQTYKIGLKQ